MWCAGAGAEASLCGARADGANGQGHGGAAVPIFGP